MAHTPPSYAFRKEGDALILGVTGDWTVMTVASVDAKLRSEAALAQAPVLDLSGVGHIDTSGAFVLDRALRAGDTQTPLADRLWRADGRFTSLMESVRAASVSDQQMPELDIPHGLYAMLVRLGRGAEAVWRELVGTLAFLGEALTTLGKLIVRPSKMRWTSVVAIAEEAGLDALPIVAFLSLFVGMVVAFIGATTLQDLGASVFVVELVGIAVLREFGIIITAIILAGRTNSAFTAQIGAMKMRQEIDAMQVIGLKPMEVLVVPRLLAMLVMVPVLAFVATAAGVIGGMVAAWATLDISPGFFLNRLVETVPVENLWVGMSKSPVVALIVALVGCRQGLAVGNSVQSLGAATTTSVVQAIFAIIVTDAIFALLYMELGI